MVLENEELRRIFEHNTESDVGEAVESFAQQLRNIILHKLLLG
jgi:hypothetical protein